MMKTQAQYKNYYDGTLKHQFYIIKGKRELINSTIE